MVKCARCQQRLAVVFITKMEGEKASNEGLCLTCAKELGIKPVEDLINKMGLSEEDMEQQTDVPIVYTDSVRRAYAEAYCRFCGLAESKMKLVAVTGTNGKTTTATMLSAILRHQRRKVGFIGTGRILSDGKVIASPYYSMTTPDPAILYPALKRMREDGCEAVIMEASSHALALEKLAPLHFDAAIFTNLSEEHLDFHRDM